MDTALQRFASLLKEAVAEEKAASSATAAASTTAVSSAAASFSPSTRSDMIDAIAHSAKSQLFLPAPYFLLVHLLPTSSLVSGGMPDAPVLEFVPDEQQQASLASEQAQSGRRRVKVTRQFAEECAARWRSDQRLRQQMQDIFAQP